MLGLVLGGVAALSACAEKTALGDPAEPGADSDDRIVALERRHNALIGLFAVDLQSGRSLAYRSSASLPVCSTFKAYAAARVLQMTERGQLSLDRGVFIDPGAVVANSPVTQPRAGGQMTLSELCQAALQRSDNTAGNLLLRAIGGPSAVTEFARSIGDEQTRLERWETELNSAIPGDPRDTSTPEALGGGYRNLLTGDVLGGVQREQLEEWMQGNQTSSMRAGLPPGWTTADKTGSGDYGSTNDVGIAYGPAGERVLLAVMTRSQADDPKAENLRPLIGELTALALPTVLDSRG
jgi:beta-lactamase class A